MREVIARVCSEVREEWRVASLDRRLRVCTAVVMLTLSAVLPDPGGLVMLLSTFAFVVLYLVDKESGSHG